MLFSFCLRGKAVKRRIVTGSVQQIAFYLNAAFSFDFHVSLATWRNLTIYVIEF